MFVFRPRWEGYPAAADAALVKFWRRHFPNAQMQECDLEEWTGFACLLRSADRAHIPVVKIPRHEGATFAHNLCAIVKQGDGPASFFLGDYQAGDRFKGLTCEYRLFGPGTDANLDVCRYYREYGFEKLSGRRSQVLTPDDSLIDALKNWPDPLFVKTGEKSIAGIFTHKEALDEFWARQSDLILQEVIDPQHEYRIVVCSEEPICGAGTVVEHTPLDNEADFDPKMRKSQRDNSPVEARPDLLALYMELAWQWIINVAWPDAYYMLDVCIDGRMGSPVVIECNPLLGSGLFAHNTDTIVKQVHSLAKLEVQDDVQR